MFFDKIPKKSLQPQGFNEDFDMKFVLVDETLCSVVTNDALSFDVAFSGHSNSANVLCQLFPRNLCFGHFFTYYAPGWKAVSCIILFLMTTMMNIRLHLFSYNALCCHLKTCVCNLLKCVTDDPSTLWETVWSVCIWRSLWRMPIFLSFLISVSSHPAPFCFMEVSGNFNQMLQWERNSLTAKDTDEAARLSVLHCTLRTDQVLSIG